MVDENPYKGVKGGDPRLRAQHVKVVVPRDFVCAECGKKKTEKFSEDKDLTGRVCVECRNAEGVQKQKEQRAEAEKRWEENRRKARNAPIRTNEEKLALIKEWEDAPKEKCSVCGGTFFIANPAMPFNADNHNRPNAIITVTYTDDPYELEVNHREMPDWFCGPCHQNIAWDV